MGLNSKIEWTDHTWNPWYGCHKVSEGCANCYMYREMASYGKNPCVVQRSKTTFRDPLTWAKKARQKGKRERVFVCSWSDFFIEEADAWRNEAWEIIRQTPELTYLILTKRPERIGECLPKDWYPGNVWWGVSIELGEYSGRYKTLLNELHYLPDILFISAEPLLGLLDLDLFRMWQIKERDGWWFHPPDWIIVGGESGPQARPCHPDWVRSIRDQCVAEGIPFFFKQWGEYLPMEPVPEQRGIIDVDYVKVGRKQAGAILDGREWRKIPEY